MKYFALAALLSGCATLFSGNTATIQVSASPGQPVTIDGAPAGTSPTTLVVSTHTDHVVVVGDASCHLVSTVGAGWVVLDILTGAVPLIVDAITGEWRSLDDKQCAI